MKKRDGQADLRMRTREIAAVRVRYGYKRIIHVLLRREGWRVNHKRVYRLYSEEGLTLRRRGRKRGKMTMRIPRPQAGRVNESWSMNFVTDSLFNGRRFRALTIVDNSSRECLGILLDQSIKGKQVVQVLERLKFARCCCVPRMICVDNGSEFTSNVMDKWAYDNGASISFSRPSKAVDNAFVESFIGSIRDECLNVNWFFVSGRCLLL